MSTTLDKGVKLTVRLEVSGGVLDPFPLADLRKYTPHTRIVSWTAVKPEQLDAAVLIYAEQVEAMNSDQLFAQISSWAEKRLPGVSRTRTTLVTAGAWPGIRYETWTPMAIIANGMVVVAAIFVAKKIFPDLRFPRPYLSFKKPRSRRSGDRGGGTFSERTVEDWLKSRPTTARSIYTKIFPTTTPTYRKPAATGTDPMFSETKSGGWGDPGGGW